MTMDRQQLQQLRDLPIEEVAARLGLEVARHKALCPFHDDHHASLSFSPQRNSYRCFVCEAHGGTIDLVMRMRHVDFLEACRWLGGDEVLAAAPKAPQVVRVEEARPFDAQRYERFFLRPWLSPSARHFLFDQRRLDPRVVRWCRLTSWRDRQGVEWLQIPYYSTEGRLVGVQNRNLTAGAQPRFRFPRGSQCGIYNLPVLGLLGHGEALYITEGASDCWAMLSAGHKAVAIPSATLLGRRDVELLTTLADRCATQFHMYPDRDAPGERLFLQLSQVLPNLTHHQLPAGCKDFGDCYLLGLDEESG